MSYSLRNRLLFLASFILLLGFSLVAWNINSAYQAGLKASVEDKLQLQILTLISLAEQENNNLTLPQILPDPRFNQLSSGLYALALDGENHEIWRSQSAISLDVASLESLSAGKKLFKSISLTNDENYFISGLGTILLFMY